MRFIAAHTTIPVLRVYGMYKDKRGVYFIIMEYIKGSSSPQALHGSKVSYYANSNGIYASVLKYESLCYGTSSSVELQLRPIRPTSRYKLKTGSETFIQVCNHSCGLPVSRFIDQCDKLYA